MKQLAMPVAHRRWWWNVVGASVMILIEVESIALGSLRWWVLCPSVPLAAVNWLGWWKTRTVDGNGRQGSMVDLGPTSPPLFYCIPKSATEALELWHAAWERDYPELLGPLGPSFYGPEVEPLLAKRGPLVPGVTMAEASANLLAATEKLKQGFPTVPDLPPLHVDPLLIRGGPPRTSVGRLRRAVVPVACRSGLVRWQRRYGPGVTSRPGSVSWATSKPRAANC